ncbi:TROVE domain-containing protein [Streptomyces sp. AJS327]|uniref:TROVE domain-containing protein n=1 Tax=Streptomyces sp. AJS327 TaxID=2545265 RepID=UPI0015DDE3C1|nr:TROVE domain-containing protein [Streptomyces sp. AJS327]MBA0050711.1 TROVE domain-containing protein [Streptomyces sp. AJS327]
MGKFNTIPARNALTVTHAGGKGYARGAKTELVLLAVVNMVGERTFYETAGDRDDRFSRLVRTVAVEDGDWTGRFVAWLRGEAQMRTAALVAAAETAYARREAGAHGLTRQVVDAACQRADEPGELLAYWVAHYGRAVPKPVKRGLADAVRRLYTERALLKYDAPNRVFRFADVLELVHPAPDPAKPWQGALFRHALDRRHSRPDTATDPARPATVRARDELSALPVERRRELLRAPDAAERLRRAGMTWEALAGWLQGPMDAEAWEAVLPSMGLMAQLRNLRNFDQAGVSDEAAQLVIDRLGDPEEIARSRQFPLRFLSAYRAAPSPRWAPALERALNASTANVPRLPGRTLVLADVSGSMLGTLSARSTVRHADVAALFAAVLARRSGAVDLYGFADSWFRQPLAPGGSVLRDIEAFCDRIGEVGYGTRTADAIRACYAGHDRVVVISDMQAFAARSGFPSGRTQSVSETVPRGTPLIGVNTTGYGPTSIDPRQPDRFEIGGFSDKLFTMVRLLSEGKAGRWPWESGA